VLKKLLPLLLVSWSLNVIAAETAAPPAPQFPRMLERLDVADGDTIVFLGDSITHQCLYTQYIEDFFYTRYPQLKLRFHNAGVGGDRAADALKRFDRDVAEYKPRYVTVLLGMNDGGYDQWTPEMFAAYERDMTTLIERIQAIGATPVLMTPTMYDTRAALLKPSARRPADSPANKYYNASLAYLGGWVREQAVNRGLGFVDMYGPLNNFTLAQRKTEANFTFIPDAVHPEADGQFIMGFSVLEQMARGPQVSSIVATCNDGSWTCIAGQGAKVSDLQGDADDVSFTLTAAVLPWVVPEEAALGARLTRAGHRISAATVRFIGLATGRYDLKIDGETVGTYSAAQLGFKIELQENPKTPEYQQALAVAMLNKERNEKAVKPLRDLWRDLKVKQRAPDAQELEKFLPEFDAKLPERRKLVEEYDQKILALNKPQPHRYELVRVAALTPGKAKAKKPALEPAVVK
jgi:lysophospholipase L1-like esterase